MKYRALFFNAGSAAMPLGVLVAMLGCHDADRKLQNRVNDQSTVSVHLLAEPAPAYQHVNLFISQVEVRAGGVWHTLARPERVMDLQAGGGAEQAIAQEVRLPRGEYDHLRLGVDPGRSNVVLADGTVRPLEVPGPLKDGIQVDVTEGPVADNLVHDLVLHLEVERSIHRAERVAGSPVFTFAPALSLNDRNGTAIISGRLVDALAQPLAGVGVMAQGGDTDQVRSLVRTVRTGADGTYRLDQLPVNRMYYVVAQPRAGEVLYEAQASRGLRPTRLDRKLTFDFPPFQPVAAGPGPEVEVRIPGQDGLVSFDAVDLMRRLPTGGSLGMFIVHRGHALPGPGEKSTFKFPPVPPGSYDLRLTRTTLAAEDGAACFNVQGHQATEVKAGEPGPKVSF